MNVNQISLKRTQTPLQAFYLCLPIKDKQPKIILIPGTSSSSRSWRSFLCFLATVEIISDNNLVVGRNVSVFQLLKP
ncbi:hypothetical protein GCM10010911_24610 [Paenibacillus nasutitermitis]|uniref:Uncharacterized protein n=1 Tax=Paenibacillus nasutitermitis TaxID=1652958 RepID=A0A917DT06_9BACL|nr:hypothetical protein GCM10010911_24610 [Paenibacillus nasutitermitis]